MLKLDNVRLLVNDYAACFRFYRDVLGFEISWGDERTGYASFNDPGGAGSQIAIFDRTEMAKAVGAAHLPKQAASQDTFALIISVPNVDQFCAILAARNIPFIHPPQDYPGWGIRAAHLRDPDGNLVELFSELSREEWSQELLEKDEQQ